MTSWDDVSQKTLEGARQLAPWRSSLPWWVAVIEGAIIAIIGLLIILDPGTANVRVALVLSLALLISGFFQFLDLNRQRAPESVDGTMGARAGIGIFAGLVLILLTLGDLLTVNGGLVILGLGSLLYGLLGFFLVFNSLGAQRRVALIETLLYTSVGVMVFYGLFGGAAQITTAITVLGWLALLGGSGIALFGFLRRGHDDEIQGALETVSQTTASVSSTFTGNRPNGQSSGSKGGTAVKGATDDLSPPSGS